MNIDDFDDIEINYDEAPLRETIEKHSGVLVKILEAIKRGQGRDCFNAKELKNLWKDGLNTLFPNLWSWHEPLNEVYNNTIPQVYVFDTVPLQDAERFINEQPLGEKDYRQLLNELLLIDHRNVDLSKEPLFLCQSIDDGEGSYLRCFGPHVLDVYESIIQHRPVWKEVAADTLNIQETDKKNFMKWLDSKQNTVDIAS